MKKILLLFICAIVLSASTIFAQGMATRDKPYRNLAVWYGTQSTPPPLEKAQWALDDINAYRAGKGLSALPESILDSRAFVRPRRLLFRGR